MREKEVKSAILHLLKKAKEEEIGIGKVRLVKLLYLLDVEYYRTYGKKYTDLDWILYKYGPFAFEVEDLCKKARIIEEDVLLKEDRIFKQLKYEDMWMEDVRLPIEPRSILEYMLRKWGSVDLNRLLDYVYFETEPMEDAKLREKLDFSKIIPSKKKKDLSISFDTKKKLRAISHNIKKHLDRIEVRHIVSPPSHSVIEITSIWDKEDVPKLSALQGIVRFEKEQKR